MINGEGWLENDLQCDLEVIKVKNYDHNTPYSLPVKPSPNLPNDLSIRLYPSLCLFEGTVVSIGRGTYFPFQVIGYPDPKFGSFSFTPKSIPGLSKYPKHENKTCFGVDFRSRQNIPEFTLQFLIDSYEQLKDDGSFFNDYFGKLAGTQELQEQIESGMSPEDIEQSWQPKLTQYKTLRKKYLLYPDFE